MLKSRNNVQWSGVLIACGVEMAIAQRWAPAFTDLMAGNALSLGEDELDDFLGNVLHECGKLKTLTENLNYSADALVRKFSRERISVNDAMKYGRIDGRHAANQEAIANCIYGGNWGAVHLGNTQPGDGWLYRGRGPIQGTGRWNYGAMGSAIGVDLINMPNLLASDPHVGLAATIRWWEKSLPDSIMNNLPAVRKRVNGGTNGLPEVEALTKAARRALALT